jgi:hypothetical protein
MVMREEPLVPEEDPPCFDASAMQILLHIILLIAGFRNRHLWVDSPVKNMDGLWKFMKQPGPSTMKVLWRM